MCGTVTGAGLVVMAEDVVVLAEVGQSIGLLVGVAEVTEQGEGGFAGWPRRSRAVLAIAETEPVPGRVDTETLEALADVAALLSKP
jgi:hypothetical protein